MAYTKEISDNERIKIMQEKLELALNKFKRQFNKDVEVLIIVHPLRYDLYCKANKNHSQVFKIVRDIPTLVFCELSDEPVPLDVKEFFRRFYNDEMRTVSSDEQRLRRMTASLMRASVQNPKIAYWMIKFKEWYETKYSPTGFGYNEVIIIPSA
jgi:hypothetical protein